MLRVFVECRKHSLKRIRRLSVLVVGVGVVGRRIEGKMGLILEGMELYGYLGGGLDYEACHRLGG